MEIEMARKLKNEDLIDFQKKTYFDKLADVFGDRNVLWWPLPIVRISEDDLMPESQLSQTYIS